MKNQQFFQERYIFLKKALPYKFSKRSNTSLNEKTEKS